MRIAIQGEPGSFSHEAAMKAAGAEATILPRALSAEVFAAVMEGSADAAVIPIENSLAGSVVEHYDLLLANDVAIESEWLLRIRHNLIGVPGAKMERLRQAYSHPVALAQCRHFFEKNPTIEAAPFYDTAGSVKQMMELRDAGIAAIASAQAASHYGGEILAVGLEDNPENYTRFFLIRRRDRLQPAVDADKVSLAFNVENRPGSLVEALQVFAGLGTNMTRLESRPVPGRPWEYVFYADYQLSDTRLADWALEMLPRHCSMVRELGRYRAAAQG
ncbi:MAG TPA: prephenate dehydratase domain-containing protein [Acidobacteriaceae bacterium]|nr:prephenate dehydratase domain-containing protein [Acidobacteriaceae bacterium]